MLPSTAVEMGPRTPVPSSREWGDRCALPAHLLGSHLLLIEPLAVRPYADLFQDRATGRLVVARSQDAPMVDATPKARKNVRTPGSNEGMNPLCPAFPRPDRTIAVSDSRRRLPPRW